MKLDDDLRKDWEKLWCANEKHWFHNPKFREDVLKPLKQRLKSNMRILDAGCGAGLYLKDLQQEDFRNAIGTDLVFCSLPISHNLKICQASLQHLPFKPNSFDAIYCVLTLEHVPDDFKALKEFSKVLKPGGLILIVVPRLVSIAGFFINLRKLLGKWFKLNIKMLPLIHVHRTYLQKNIFKKIEQTNYTVLDHYNLNILDYVVSRQIMLLVRVLEKVLPWKKYFGDELVILIKKNLE